MTLVPILRRVAFIPVASSYLLLSGQEVMAHADHSQTKQSEQPASDSPQSERSGEPVETLGSAEKKSTSAAKKEAVAQVSVPESESSSISSNGFAEIGIGEALLALILAAPFILRVLKRRLKF